MLETVNYIWMRLPCLRVPNTYNTFGELVRFICDFIQYDEVSDRCTEEWCVPKTGPDGCPADCGADCDWMNEQVCSGGMDDMVCKEKESRLQGFGF